ncbi:diguanylate cyclase [Rhodanobacter sp. C05]|uniref:tetratricopeptide repeat-containing diguanylate cyclase n=1 Tax=Rhodanobacter sp. C05 TaxID=1945855 RepID=UPI00098587B6|nr:diguanylate cyclase [Rhodanobacter sp. C05]
MDQAGRYRLVFRCCAFLLLFVAGAVAATAPVSNDPAQLLRQAENVEPSNHAVFDELMGRLDKVATRLSPQQKLHHRYLLARQIAFAGNYAAALPSLTALADQTADPVLAFRASANVIDLLVAQSRYEEAFARLNPFLDQLPQIKENDVRIQGLTATAQLYTEAGQYDVSMSYADQLIKESTDAQSACRGWFLKSDALFESGNAQLPAKQLHDGTEACEKAGDTLFSLSFQYLLAGFDMRQGRPESAIRLLQANYPKVLLAGFPPQVSEFEATLARAYWSEGDFASATKFANDALATNANRPYSESTANAYQVLYEVDKKAGDSNGALANLEKYVVAHDGYLSRLSAKALAYQIVKQQVLAKKLQIESLDKKNKILTLQGELDHKAAVTSRLYIVLLLMVLATIALWTYRIKRSQLRFMKLARRDGLTGIFNRQHFVNEAELLLQYCRKSSRDACLVLIDLDHFKAVNDTHGHAVGDRVLQRAVEACKTCLRSTDIFGRLGGEEFGILLPECTLGQVVVRAEQIRLAIATAATGENAPGIPISASFGASSVVHSGYELRQLMIHADAALYRAKREGRNRVNVVVHPGFDDSMPRDDLLGGDAHVLQDASMFRSGDGQADG